jgi:hypothetical protein
MEWMSRILVREMAGADEDFCIRDMGKCAADFCSSPNYLVHSNRGD